MAYFTPTIGQAGLYELAGPFHQALTPGVSYTCRSLRTINDVVASGIDVWQVYYEKPGVSIEAYQADLINNVCIVGLQGGVGDWVYVPASHIVRAPELSGVNHSPLMLGVYLGMIDDNVNLDAVTEAIKGAVQAYIGTSADIKPVIVGPSVLLSEEQMLTVARIRAAAMKNKETDFVRAQRLEVENTKLKATVEALNKYIADNR